MRPRLAVVLTLRFIAWLFRHDFHERPNVTGALWLPTLWVLIAASRPVTTWLNRFDLPVGGAASLEEGGPLDSVVYELLNDVADVVTPNRDRVYHLSVIRGDNRDV
jgi:hypothetical protein